jgi:hypothetical protein
LFIVITWYPGGGSEGVEVAALRARRLSVVKRTARKTCRGNRRSIGKMPRPMAWYQDSGNQDMALAL